MAVQYTSSFHETKKTVSQYHCLGIPTTSHTSHDTHGSVLSKLQLEAWAIAKLKSFDI